MKILLTVLLLITLAGCKPIEMRHTMPDGTVYTCPYSPKDPGNYKVHPESGRRYSWQ